MNRILILGCGHAGTAIARLAHRLGLSVVANVRSATRSDVLRAEGFEVLQKSALDGSIGSYVDPSTHVVVAFPPDGITDALVAPSVAHAGRVTYVSSTGVYGGYRGVVDDRTPLPENPNPRAAQILEAEEQYRAVGGTVLRCPALYGRDRGLVMRVLRREHRVPGDGTRYLSRIHVDDLAQLVLSGIGIERGETLIVGDLEPAPHIEVVRFICKTYGVPMPAFVPLESVHESLRADRRVDGTRALSKRGVTLLYPSYRDGMSREATGLPFASDASDASDG